MAFSAPGRRRKRLARSALLQAPVCECLKPGLATILQPVLQPGDRIDVIGKRDDLIVDAQPFAQAGKVTRLYQCHRYPPVLTMKRTTCRGMV